MPTKVSIPQTPMTATAPTATAPGAPAATSAPIAPNGPNGPSGRAMTVPKPAAPAKGVPASVATAPGPRETRPARPTRRGSASKTKPERGSWRWVDVAGAATLAVAAGIGAAVLEPGPLRLALTLPMVLFVPGYLLLQAFRVPAASGRELGWQALASLGISPAVLGLLALSTAIVEGGFRLGVILVTTTVACLLFATAALVRRRSLAATAKASDAKPSGTASATGASGPASATAKSGSLRP